MGEPLAIALQPSRQLGGLLLAAHAAALAAVFLADLPAALQAALAAAVAMSGWRLRQARRIQRLDLGSDGRVRLEYADGRCLDAVPERQSTVTARLCLLLLLHARGSETLLLLPDALDGEDFRRLRLWLRQSALPG